MKIAVIGGAGVRTVIFINGLLKRCRKLDIDPMGFLWNTSPPPLDCRLFYCLKREVHNSKKEGLGIKRTEVDDKALNFGK